MFMDLKNNYSSSPRVRYFYRHLFSSKTFCMEFALDSNFSKLVSLYVQCDYLITYFDATVLFNAATRKSQKAVILI